jgi:hypothetical protein
LNAASTRETGSATAIRSYPLVNPACEIIRRNTPEGYSDLRGLVGQTTFLMIPPRDDDWGGRDFL